MIAVVGATGNTGRAVVKELTQLGHTPICVVRNPDKAREVLGGDAKTVVAELTDRPALEKAFKGLTSVFVVTGHNPNMVEQQNNVLDAALAAGVHYLVRVSGSRFFILPNSPSVIGRGHYAIEEGCAAAASNGSSCDPASCKIPSGKRLRSRMTARSCCLSPPICRSRSSTCAIPACRRTRAPRSRTSCRRGLRIYRRAEQFWGISRCVLAGARPQGVRSCNIEQAEQVMKGRGMPDWLITHQRTAGQIAAKGWLAGGTLSQ